MLVICFAVATLCYAAFSTIVLALPADLYKTGNVASVSGLSGTGAGIGTIAATYLTGVVSDRYSFEPILIVASLVPLLATAVCGACSFGTEKLQLRGSLTPSRGIPYNGTEVKP